MTEPEHFNPMLTARAEPYLRIQQGRLNAITDPVEWHDAYRTQLVETFEAIDQFIPRPCRSVLDIGGGMGGFDALLNYMQPGLAITILDGEVDRPVTDRDKAFSKQTYSNRDAADEFLRANGVEDLAFFAAGALPEPHSLEKFDLILSLQAWCFHFPPEVYMKFALGCSAPGTIWILDVRIMNRFWASDLFSQARLEPIGEAEGFNGKYTRMAFLVTE